MANSQSPTTVNTKNKVATYRLLKGEKTMKINYEKKIIEMTKVENKEAGNPNSELFKQLIELRKLFPDYSISVKTTTRRDPYKGIGYDFMEEYIKKHDDADGNKMKKFNTLRGYNEKGIRDVTIEEHSFGEVKMWFLDTFPEIEKFNEQTNKELAEIKAKRAEARKCA